MGKRYLNSQEKRVVLTLASFISYFDEYVPKWQQLKRPKEMIKYSKMARSFAGKVLDYYMKELDPDEVKNMLKQLEKMELVTKWRDEAIREREKMKKLESTTVIETDKFLKIVELALASCSVCESMDDEVRDCPFRKIMLEEDIEPLTPNPPAGGCPYRHYSKK